MFERSRRIVGFILGPVLLIIAALIFYGVAIEPRLLLDVQDTRAHVPELAEGWHGAEVAFLADQQTGMWLDNTGMVEEAVEEALEREPDLILLGGDFIYHPDQEAVGDALELARPLAQSGIPTFAVLGNHDYSMDKKDDTPNQEIARELEEGLETMGIQVLQNEARTVTRNGDELYVVGVGSHWAQNDDPEVALGDVPKSAPRIVLMHNPVTWRDFPAYSAPFSVAGHTHGGQLRLPFFESESWLDIAENREVVADAWVNEKDSSAPGNRIYVTRGLGFSLIPMRLFCRPELTIFRLGPGDPYSSTDN